MLFSLFRLVLILIVDVCDRRDRNQLKHEGGSTEPRAVQSGPWGDQAGRVTSPGGAALLSPASCPSPKACLAPSLPEEPWGGSGT